MRDYFLFLCKSCSLSTICHWLIFALTSAEWFLSVKHREVLQSFVSLYCYVEFSIIAKILL